MVARQIGDQRVLCSKEGIGVSAERRAKGRQTVVGDVGGQHREYRLECFETPTGFIWRIKLVVVRH